MMTVMSAHGLGEILKVGQLSAGGCGREIRGELIELSRRGSVSARLRLLGRRLKVRGDLLRNLLILSWIVL